MKNDFFTLFGSKNLEIYDFLYLTDCEWVNWTSHHTHSHITINNVIIIIAIIIIKL